MNPAFRGPGFRAPGNRRTGSGILFQGPWRHPDSDGVGRGLFEPGQLWIRYYAPDRGRGPLGGVPYPKLAFETAEGTRFFIAVGKAPWRESVDTTTDLGSHRFGTPSAMHLETAEHGWFKQTGIVKAVTGGIALGTGWADKPYVRQLALGVEGRGQGVAAPGDYEQSATSATYIDYLVRGMSLEEEHVVVLTGRIPRFPDTRAGAARMTAAEMRYWSITGYHVPQGFEFLGTLFGAQNIGLAVHAVMDDAVVLDQNRDYVIVLSRDTERPANATAANGVTWIDWGPSAQVSWTLRWMSVGPDWKAPFTPTPEHFGWEADYYEANFDPRVVGQNGHNGALGRYLPKVHTMTRSAFEALGPRVRAARIPDWQP